MTMPRLPKSFDLIIKSEPLWPLLCLLLAALLLFPLGLGNNPLWDYHEPYVGGIVREMASSGHWVVPTLNGQPYLEKPPLFYFLSALGCRALGTFEPWAIRLPSAMLAMATTLWSGFLGWRLRSPRAGAWAGILVATNVLFFRMGHLAVVDMTLTAAVTLSVGMALLAIHEPEHRRGWVAGFWATLGLAFLAKGVFGPLVVLVPVLGALALQRERTMLAALLRPNWGMAAMAGLVLLWVVPLAMAGGREFLEEVFLRNTLGRFFSHPELVPRTGRLGEHVEPFYFYLKRTPGNLLPWLAIWAAALGASLPWRGRDPARPKEAFLPLFFVLNLLLLSLSRGKRMVYLLPILPATFVHAGLWLDQCMPARGMRAGRAVKAALWFTVSVIGLPWAALARLDLPWPLAMALSSGAALLTWAAAAALRVGNLPRAVQVAMVHWAGFLIVFMALALPHLDQEWRPILTPFRMARTLEAAGCAVFESNLTETQLGYASLEFRHVLPSAPSRPAVEAVLGSSSPAALLMEPHFLQAEQRTPWSFTAVAMPMAASRSGRLRDRTPALILNARAAWLFRSRLANRGYSGL